jgi:hypothetical protein
VWESFVAEASGLALYARETPTGSLGADCEALMESERAESEPSVWEMNEGSLQITVRALRTVGARRDQMISQAIGWLLSSAEAEDRQALVSLTYRLGPSTLLLGFVADPPIQAATDARFDEVLRLTAETEGLLFNGVRFRGADGQDLAWASPQVATRRRRWGLRRSRS